MNNERQYSSFLKSFLLLCFISPCIFVFGQAKKSPPLYGVSVMHDIQDKGTAPELRANFSLFKNICVAPRFSYFPRFNDIHEFYIGTDLDIYVPLRKKYSPFIFAGAYYNNWVNSSEYHNSLAKRNNFAFECGGGLIFAYKCFYPFLEGRYDTKWKEGIVGVGLLLQFGECFGRSSARKCSRF